MGVYDVNSFYPNASGGKLTKANLSQTGRYTGKGRNKGRSTTSVPKGKNGGRANHGKGKR